GPSRRRSPAQGIGSSSDRTGRTQGLAQEAAAEDPDMGEQSEEAVDRQIGPPVLGHRMSLLVAGEDLVEERGAKRASRARSSRRCPPCAAGSMSVHPSEVHMRLPAHRSPCTRAGASTPSPLIPSNAPSAIASTAEAMVAVSSSEGAPSTAERSGARRPAVQNSERDVSDSVETSNGASSGPKNAEPAGDQPKPGAPASCRRANRRPKSTAAAASGP